MNAIVIKCASEATPQQNRSIQLWLKKQKYRMKLQQQEREYQELCVKRKNMKRKDLGENAFAKALKK
jgi:hypothetical protein